MVELLIVDAVMRIALWFRDLRVRESGGVKRKSAMPVPGVRRKVYTIDHTIESVVVVE